MKRRTFIKRTGAAGLITVIAPSNFARWFNPSATSTLESDFRKPPLSSFPQTMWFWVNGNVSREGITLDLEAMKQAGIGGFFNFDVGTGIPNGPVAYLGKEWVELKKHAINEAHRLGLEFVMHNCPGWSSSGGPWITPELAMQQVTWSETFISGDKDINLHLTKPPNRLNYYRDIAVVAFPSLEREDLLQKIVVSTSDSGLNKQVLTTQNQEEGIVAHPTKNGESAWLRFEFEEAYEAKLLTFYIAAIPDGSTRDIPLELGERTSIVLEASDDGIVYRTVTPINTGLETELLKSDKLIVFDIPVTKAKYFRLSSSKARRYRQVQFSGITRLKNWMEKTNLRARTSTYVEETSTIDQNNEQQVPQSSLVNADSVVDISKYVDNNGFLTWHAPAGNWTILRIGFTPTGTPNRAAPETGVGLECDKYSRTAFDFHFSKMMEQFLPLVEEVRGKGKLGLEIDSYEAGAQNWTLGFETMFSKFCGYDLNKFLPALAGGRIVGNVDLTERFLWDLRKVQATLIADNYYGRFHELCQLHGMTAYMEPYESGPFEEMQIGSRGDVNLGEFWNGIFTASPVKRTFRRTLRLASSIAHTNGQKLVGAEAFTSDPDSGRWQAYPFALKALGDKAYTNGVNRLIIHRFAHQPHPTAKPGMTMGPWGIHFERTTTWWKQGKEWLQYLSRCQHMLRQGHFVADLVYFTGEDANMYTRAAPEELEPPPPEGYDYDLINAETILKYGRIEKGRLSLSDGMSYKVFVLQNYKAISVPMLRKIKEMVDEGLILVGSKPERSTGLMNYADDDAVFKTIADDLWGGVDGHTVTEKAYGRGRVYWGRSLKSVLNALQLPPDFEFTSRSGDAPVLYTHRKFNDTDVYFVSNQRRSYEELVCTFRVGNKAPESWNPVTGKILKFGIYDTSGDRVRLPIQLEPYGSTFIIFRSTPSSKRIVEVRKDKRVILSSNNYSPTDRNLHQGTANNFSICFWAKPEINILLNPSFTMGSIGVPWTEFYAIYPANGKDLYGKGHATCGVAVGRNGIAVWEDSSGSPELVLAAPVNISGWGHVAIVYTQGIPMVYFDGRIINEGKKSKNHVHPSVDKVYLSEGASFYNGDMSEPVLFDRVLSESDIARLLSQEHPLQDEDFDIEITETTRPGLLIKENGRYQLQNLEGMILPFEVSNIHEPFEIKGPWEIHFPPDLGAPPQIVLPELSSLHRHSTPGVKYFSGTATYRKTFSLTNLLSKDKLYYLDLGGVEVIAEVRLNGKDLGILWSRPYKVDITNVLKQGSNSLEIKVTNLWPNRLIGDEQIPDPDVFAPGAGASGMEGLTGGYIERFPRWFVEGDPKPTDGRICFATWKHYVKTSPLLESGLIGPVKIREAMLKDL